MSIEATEAESAAVAKAPDERVSLESMRAKIDGVFEFTAAEALGGSRYVVTEEMRDTLRLLSICIVVMQNGFMVVGKSAPASAKNFNRDLGRKFAFEDAIRQLWPLEGYALRERLAAG